MSRMVFDVGGTAIKYSVMDETLRQELDELYSNSGLYFDPGLPKPELVHCRFGSEANQIGAYLYYEKGSAQIST